MTEAPAPRLWTPAAVAADLGLHRNTILHAIRTGRLEATRVYNADGSVASFGVALAAARALYLEDQETPEKEPNP